MLSYISAKYNAKEHLKLTNDIQDRRIYFCFIKSGSGPGRSSVRRGVDLKNFDAYGKRGL